MISLDRLLNLSALPLDGSTGPNSFCPVHLSSKNGLKRVCDFGLVQSGSRQHYTDPTATSINPAASLTCDATEIFRSRVVYQSQIAGALQDIIQPPGPLMPQSSVFLDYIPWVRYMVMVDDDLERIAQEEMSRGKSGRTTRNSMKTRHIRNIDLDERQQDVLCRTRLDGKYRGTIERAVQEEGSLI